MTTTTFRTGYGTTVTTDHRHFYYEDGPIPRATIPEIEARNANLTADEIDALNHEHDLGQIAAWSRAGDALFTMADSLERVKKGLARIDPTLADKAWDFTLEGRVDDPRDPARLVARGAALDDKDRQLIESFLNTAPGLLKSASALAQSSFDVNDINGSGSVHGWQTNALIGRTGVNYYKNVAQQLDGQIRFRQLLQDTVKAMTHSGGWTDDHTAWGLDAVRLMEAYLTPSEPIVG